MNEALEAAEEIFSAALQIMNSRGVNAKMAPLIMGTVTSRLNAFAIGEMAHELCDAARNEQEESDAS
jgi:hypothetical protein